jgi:hypothetical protein
MLRVILSSSLGIHRPSNYPSRPDDHVPPAVIACSLSSGSASNHERSWGDNGGGLGRACSDSPTPTTSDVGNACVYAWPRCAPMSQIMRVEAINKPSGVICVRCVTTRRIVLARFCCKGIFSGLTPRVRARSNMFDRTGIPVSHAPAVRRNRTNASGPIHPWSKFAAGLCRLGRCWTARVSSH